MLFNVIEYYYNLQYIPYVPYLLIMTTELNDLLTGICIKLGKSKGIYVIIYFLWHMDYENF